jgi:hypothetical protein
VRGRGRQQEKELRRREEQPSALEDRLNREREALETRENMAGKTTVALARCQEELLQRETTL